MKNQTARKDNVIPLHETAVDHLSVIRETMEQSSRFTAVPGKGFAAMGAIAIVGTVVASNEINPYWWFNTWFVTAIVAGGVGFSALVMKVRASDQRLMNLPMKRFFLSFTPPMLAALVITDFVYRLGQLEWLPGVWLLLYGTAVVSGGTYSIRAVPIMGSIFMALGACYFLLPVLLNFQPAIQGYWMDVWMGLGFGVVHLVFGSLIAARHGG
jgi:hypothetical protein